MDKNQRKAIRQNILSQRSRLTYKQQQQASHLIIQQALRSSIFLRSHRIAFYLANRGEVDTLPLLEKALSWQKECYLPILHPIKHNQMWFGRFELGDPLKKNCFGIYEPDLHYAESIAPWSLDLVITPLVAFDPQGHRLGMGGGYYDRTFSFLQHKSRHKPRLLGLAYSFQQFPDIPSQQWDVGLDLVATENNLYQFRS